MLCTSAGAEDEGWEVARRLEEGRRFESRDWMAAAEVGREGGAWALMWGSGVVGSFFEDLSWRSSSS